MPHVVSTVSLVTHQKPAYGSFPFIHLLIPLKFIFLSLPSNPGPQGTFLPWEHGHVLSKAGDQRRSQFEFS